MARQMCEHLTDAAAEAQQAADLADEVADRRANYPGPETEAWIVTTTRWSPVWETKGGKFHTFTSPCTDYSGEKVVDLLKENYDRYDDEV